MFKIGDKVVCINPGDYNRFLIKGEHYVIGRITDDGYVSVVGNNLPVFSHRFKLLMEFNIEMTYKHLYSQAKNRNIPNRSKMNKQQLLEALNKAQPLVAKKAAETKAAIIVPPPLGMQLRAKVDKATRGGYGICSFAYKCVGYKDPMFYPNAVCHASLQSFDGPGMEEAVEDICRHVQKNPYLDEYKEYLDYLLNRSPYKEGYITKDVEEAAKSGLYMNTGMMFSRMAACFIASREGSEFPNRVKLFSGFKKAGISENVSWLLANFTSQMNDGYAINALSNGHSVLNYTMHYEDVCKFFKEGFHRDLKELPANKAGNRYTIFKSIARCSAANYDEDSRVEEKDQLFTVIKKTLNYYDKPKKFGEREKIYTLEELKPLIDKLEKDFSV